MKIDAFGVEIWMNRFETQCRHNMAETCVNSITFDDLMQMTGKQDAIRAELGAMKLTYGAIEGSARLKQAIARLYDDRPIDHILVTHGAAGANALLYQTLIEPGDEVITFVPTYQQHTAIPKSLGAIVRPLLLRAEDGYAPDLAALRALITPRTRMIALANPNNPTGAVLSDDQLRAIADIARDHDLWVLSDEVYRGINQGDDTIPKSIADVYARGIAVGSMSKAFALAGLRLGWIVAPPELLHKVMIHRDYNTISVGMIDDHIASIALENSGLLLARNRAIVRANLDLLAQWVANEPLVSWHRPTGATVTLLHYAIAMDSEDFCVKFLEETGVLLVPGVVFGIERAVRIGFGNNPAALAAGLPALSGFLQRHAR
jgi:aspartate/methionine/tyrosine aminotransferase